MNNVQLNYLKKNQNRVEYQQEDNYKRDNNIKNKNASKRDFQQKSMIPQSKQGVIPSFITQVNKDGKPVQYYASEDETENEEKEIEPVPSFFERLCSCFKTKKVKEVDEEKEQSIQEDINQESKQQQQQYQNYQQQGNLAGQTYSQQMTPKPKLPIQTNQPKFVKPQDAKYQGLKSLVIDLDETLVHSSFTPIQDADFTLSVLFKRFSLFHQSFEEQITVQNMPFTVYVKKRPGCEIFLQELCKYYELIIYTASLSEYADPVMDIIDRNKVCSFRLFRENCTLYNGIFVKDLSLMNRDLKDVIIIDNSETSFLFQPANAIHIKSFFDDMKDRELFRITPMLIFLSNSYDVRHVGNWWREFEQNDFIEYRDKKNKMQRLNKVKMLKELGDLRLKNYEESEANSQRFLKSGDSQTSPKNSNNTSIQLKKGFNQNNQVKLNKQKQSTSLNNKQIIVNQDNSEGINKKNKDSKKQLMIEVEEMLPASRDISSQSINEVESAKNQLIARNQNDQGSTKQKYGVMFKFNECEDYNSRLKEDPHNFKTQPDALEENSQSYKEMRKIFENIRYSYNNKNINSPVSKQKFADLLQTNSFRKKTDKSSTVNDQEQHYFASPKKQFNSPPSPQKDIQGKRQAQGYKDNEYEAEVLQESYREQDLQQQYSCLNRQEYDQIESQRQPLQESTNCQDNEQESQVKKQLKQKIELQLEEDNQIQFKKQIRKQIDEDDQDPNLSNKYSDEIVIISKDENQNESTSTERHN